MPPRCIWTDESPIVFQTLQLSSNGVATLAADNTQRLDGSRVVTVGLDQVSREVRGRGGFVLTYLGTEISKDH